MNCLHCNKETNNAKLCSRSCSALFNNSKLKGMVIKPLEETTKQELVSRSKYLSSAFSTIRFHARKYVYKHKPRVCESCGYSKHTEVCHIKPITDFSDDTPLSTINSLDNIIILCPNCHWEYDNGLLYH